VISVDGINVINGELAEMTCENGYVLNPHSNLLVEGWRISDDQVKEFVFTFNKDQSYSVKLGQGKETLGVIGVAFFRAKELENKTTTIIHHYPTHYPPYWYPWYVGPYIGGPYWGSPTTTIYGGTTSGVTSGTNSSNYNINSVTYTTSSTGDQVMTTGMTNGFANGTSSTLNTTSLVASTSEPVNLMASAINFAAGTRKGDVIDSQVTEVTIPDCLYVGTETIYYDSYENLKKRGVIREASVGLPKPFKNTKYCEDI
jgi:hypothetical protein